MRVLDEVVLGLGPVRVAGHAAALAQLAEAVHPAGQQLVHVGLVAGVPDDLIGRGVEDPVQRDGQLHDAQVRTEMTAVARDRLDQERPDLGGELEPARPG